MIKVQVILSTVAVVGDFMASLGREKADRITEGAYRMDEQFFSSMFVIGHD